MSLFPPFGTGENSPIQTNSNNFFKFSGTRTRVPVTPVGNMFKGTGVYAPRVGRRRGTADTMGRGTTSVPTTSGTRANTGSNFYTDANGNPSYFGLNTWQQLGWDDPTTVANEAANNIESFMNPPSGSGGGGNPYTNAIKILQERLNSGGYGTSYDNLSTMLGTTATGAGQRIDEATASALAGLRSSDPMAAYQFNAAPTQIPQTVLNNYLNSIGSSTSSVDAGRQLLQGMIDAQTASAGQYATGNQQAFDLMRQSAQAALTGNQQYAQSQLALARQAQEMAIAQAKERERKAIEDQILEYVLRGGRR